MSNCIHCNKELTPEYRAKSAPLPEEKNLHFLMCKRCGFVMIAEMNGEKILSVEPTPNDLEAEETITMMRKARELFSQASIRVSNPVLDPEVDEAYYTEEDMEPEDLEDALAPRKKKPGLGVRLIAWLRRTMKREEKRGSK